MTIYSHGQEIWLRSMAIYGSCAPGCKELQSVGSHMYFL